MSKVIDVISIVDRQTPLTHYAAAQISADIVVLQHITGVVGGAAKHVPV